jgi:hypothetical protein
MSEDPTFKADPEQMMSLLNAASSLTVPHPPASTQTHVDLEPEAAVFAREGDHADDVPLTFPQKVSPWIA